MMRHPRTSFAVILSAFCLPVYLVRSSPIAGTAGYALQFDGLTTNVTSAESCNRDVNFVHNCTTTGGLASFTIMSWVEVNVNRNVTLAHKDGEWRVDIISGVAVRVRLPSGTCRFTSLVVEVTRFSRF